MPPTGSTPASFRAGMLYRAMTKWPAHGGADRQRLPVRAERERVRALATPPRIAPGCPTASMVPSSLALASVAPSGLNAMCSTGYRWPEKFPSSTGVLAVAHIPQPDRPVVAGRGELRAVGAERHRCDALGAVDLRRRRDPAARQAPQLDGVGIGSGLRRRTRWSARPGSPRPRFRAGAGGLPACTTAVLVRRPMSHRSTPPLSVPVTRDRPSGVKARLFVAVSSGITPARARVDTFHNSTRPTLGFVVLVEMPAATVVPSGLKARLVTCGSGMPGRAGTRRVPTCTGCAGLDTSNSQGPPC